MRQFFLKKLKNRLSHEKNRLWRYLPVEMISTFGLCKKGSKAILFNRLNRSVGPVGMAFDDLAINKTDSDIILREAAAAYNHIFNLLGSGPIHIHPINWHSDFKSGYEWKKGEFYQDYNVDVKTDEIDGKVPWELNRCQHLLWLGEAYRLTENNKYAKEIVDEIIDWTEENPLMHSVNWTCSMDVAFRATNWMYAVALISDSEVVSELFVKKLSKSLYQHGFFIYNNLEKSIPYSNNHYASDLVGLLFLGAFFRDTIQGKRWYSFAKKEYYREVLLQTLVSGANYERSISYHRMMTELFSSAYYLLKRFNEDVPTEVKLRIERTYGFVKAYIKSNGFAPQIEDNDDGRFVPFVKRDYRDHSYLLNNESVENILIRAGLKERLSILSQEDFSDAGHWIYRNGDAYLFFTNGGQSRYDTGAMTVTTHTHNDLLSFELCLGKDDVIIDPGTYQYLFSSRNNPHGRNEFRSTMKHNTIIVDGEEQHILSDKNLFSIRKNAVIDSENSYHTLSGLKHKRTVGLNNDSLTINDCLEKQGDNHYLRFLLHFANEVTLRQNGRDVIFDTEHYRGKVSFPSFVKDINILDDTVSPSYGVLLKSQTVEMSTVFSDRTQLTTLISWERK